MTEKERVDLDTTRVMPDAFKQSRHCEPLAAWQSSRLTYCTQRNKCPSLRGVAVSTTSQSTFISCQRQLYLPVNSTTLSMMNSLSAAPTNVGQNGLPRQVLMHLPRNDGGILMRLFMFLLDCRASLRSARNDGCMFRVVLLCFCEPAVPAI